MSTTSYLVRWVINIDARTPVEAAQRALDIQRDPSSIATIFEVQEPGPNGINFQIDVYGAEPDVTLIEPQMDTKVNQTGYKAGPEPANEDSVRVTPAQEIVDWFQKYYGATITGQELIDAMALVNSRNLRPAEAAAEVFSRRPADGRKAFGIDVRVDLHYDVPANHLPAFATETGVEKMIEDAFSDHNKPLTLADFNKDGILGLEPAEISIVNVLSA